jgi:hypothetical protein
VSVHTTTAVTHPLCFYALTLFSHIHSVRMQHSCCHVQCTSICADHSWSDTHIDHAYAPPFFEQMKMVCHVRWDKPCISAGVIPNAMQTACMSCSVLLYRFVATLSLDPTLGYHVQAYQRSEVTSRQVQSTMLSQCHSTCLGNVQSLIPIKKH